MDALGCPMARTYQATPRAITSRESRCSTHAPTAVGHPAVSDHSCPARQQPSGSGWSRSSHGLRDCGSDLTIYLACRPCWCTARADRDFKPRVSSLGLGEKFPMNVADRPRKIHRGNEEESMQEAAETFEFADFTITSREWQNRSSGHDVVNPSSDNGRAAWSSDAEE